MGLFDRPEQIRAAQAAQRAQNPLQTLAGSLFNLGNTGGNAAIRGLFDADTRSPAEIQAAENQQLLQGLDPTDRNSMLQTVQQLSAAGRHGEALQLMEQVPKLAAAKDRPTYSDVNGRRRYTDNGELVNASVVKDTADDEPKGDQYQLIRQMEDGTVKQIGTKFLKDGDSLPKLPSNDLSWAKIGTPRGTLNEINLPGEIDPFIKTLGKEMAVKFSDQHTVALDAAKSLRSQAESGNLLDDGVITGTGAQFVTGVGKFLMRVGVIDETSDTAELLARTEAYQANQAKEVGEIIKLFGAGTGLSDADREYAEKAAAGKITMTEGSLRRIVTMNNKVRRKAIQLHNKRAAAVMKKAGGTIPFDLSVPLPDVNDPFTPKVDPKTLSDDELLKQLGLN